MKCAVVCFRYRRMRSDRCNILRRSVGTLYQHFRIISLWMSRGIPVVQQRLWRFIDLFGYENKLNRQLPGYPCCLGVTPNSQTKIKRINSRQCEEFAFILFKFTAFPLIKQTFCLCIRNYSNHRRTILNREPNFCQNRSGSRKCDQQCCRHDD